MIRKKRVHQALSLVHTILVWFMQYFAHLIIASVVLRTNKKQVVNFFYTLRNLFELNFLYIIWNRSSTVPDYYSILIEKSFRIS